MASYSQIAQDSFSQPRENGTTKEYRFTFNKKDGSSQSYTVPMIDDVEIKHGDRSDSVEKPIKNSECNFKIKGLETEPLLDEISGAGLRVIRLTVENVGDSRTLFEGYVHKTFQTKTMYEDVQGLDVRCIGAINDLSGIDPDDTNDLTIGQLAGKIDTLIDLDRSVDLYTSLHHDGQSASDPLPEKLKITREEDAVGYDDDAKFVDVIKNVMAASGWQIFQKDGRLIIADLYDRFNSSSSLNKHEDDGSGNYSNTSEDVEFSLDETNVIHGGQVEEQEDVSSFTQQFVMNRRSTFWTDPTYFALSEGQTKINEFDRGLVLAGEVVRMNLEGQLVSNTTPGENDPVSGEFDYLEIKLTDLITGDVWYYDIETDEWVNGDTDFTESFDFDGGEEQDEAPFSFDNYNLSAAPEDVEVAEFVVTAKCELTIDSGDAISVLECQFDEMVYSFVDLDSFHSLAHKYIATGNGEIPNDLSRDVLIGDIEQYSAAQVFQYSPSGSSSFEGTTLWVSPTGNDTLPAVVAERVGTITVGKGVRFTVEIRDLDPISLLNVFKIIDNDGNVRTCFPIEIKHRLFAGYYHIRLTEVRDGVESTSDNYSLDTAGTSTGTNSSPSTGGGASDHGDLSGLGDPSDHPWALQTNANNAELPDARQNLGLQIGTDVQAHDADLDTIAALTPSEDDILIADENGQWTAGAIDPASFLATETDQGVVFYDADEGSFDTDADLTFEDDLLSTPAISVNGQNLFPDGGEQALGTPDSPTWDGLTSNDTAHLDAFYSTPYLSTFKNNNQTTVVREANAPLGNDGWYKVGKIMEDGEQGKVYIEVLGLSRSFGGELGGEQDLPDTWVIMAEKWSSGDPYISYYQKNSNDQTSEGRFIITKEGDDYILYIYHDRYGDFTVKASITGRNMTYPEFGFDAQSSAPDAGVIYDSNDHDSVVRFHIGDLEANKGTFRDTLTGADAVFSDEVEVNGIIDANDDIILDDADTNISTDTFASGFAGNGLAFLNDGDWNGTLDNLTVRQRLRVYELLINQVRATNGSLVVTSATKTGREDDLGFSPVEQLGGTLDWTSSDPFWTESDQYWYRTYRVYIEENQLVPFVEDDLIISQRFTGGGTYVVEGTVINVENGAEDPTDNSTRRYFDMNITADSDVPTSGMDFVRWGNLSDPDRQGVLYFTSDDEDAPYMDIVYGMDSHAKRNASGTVKGRIGRLDGIIDPDFPTLDGNQTNEFGVYINGGYFNNVEVRGTITVLDENASNAATKDYVDNATSASGNQIIRSDSEPSERTDGSPLVEGDMWEDTDASSSDDRSTSMWDGSDWVEPFTVINGAQIATESIAASSIDVTDLFAQDVTINSGGSISAESGAYSLTDDAIVVNTGGGYRSAEFFLDSEGQRMSLGDGLYMEYINGEGHLFYDAIGDIIYSKDQQADYSSDSEVGTINSDEWETVADLGDEEEQYKFAKDFEAKFGINEIKVTADIRRTISGDATSSSSVELLIRVNGQTGASTSVTTSSSTTVSATISGLSLTPENIYTVEVGMRVTAVSGGDFGEARGHVNDRIVVRGST